jgi:hypothetical protein
MKNIQDVLREKETEVEKLTREVKLLRAAAHLLEDESLSRAGPGRICPSGFVRCETPVARNSC